MKGSRWHIKPCWVADGIGYIPLTAGRAARVDPELIPELVKFNWCLYGTAPARQVYVGRKKKVVLPLGEAVVGIALAAGYVVDHKNLDTLDNRRENLRIASHAENMRNRRMLKSSKTGFKGVRKIRDRFEARIIVNKKAIYLGSRKTAAEAALLYAEAAPKYHGEFARLA